MNELDNSSNGTSGEPQVSRLPENDYGCLLVLTGYAVGRLFKLSQARHVIGQAINATIKLQDAGVAAHHAELRQENGDVILVALEQNAETYVNGTPVQQRILSNGDRIQLGTVATLKYTTVPLTLTREQTGCVVDTLPAQGDTNAVGSSGTYRKPATT